MDDLMKAIADKKAKIEKRKQVIFWLLINLYAIILCRSLVL